MTYNPKDRAVCQPTLDANIRKRLGQQLRAHFDHVVEAPLPPTLAVLLMELQERLSDGTP